MNVQLIFPTPVAYCELGFDLSTEELNFLRNQPRRENRGNEYSINDYILDRVELKRIRDSIQEHLTNYCVNVWKAELEPMITQSWVNWTAPGGYHHRHNHPNSLYSGVLYIDVEEDRDAITFYQPNYQQLLPKYTEYNAWNSYWWKAPVRNGLLVLFPSGLSHMVDPIKEGSSKERISLAFNTFAKNFGVRNELTELGLD